jgi:AbrB family looped-hinge helix DNA binding protein
MVARSIELPLDDDGRITVPAETRRELGLEPGDLLRLVVPSRAKVTLPENPTSFLDYLGVLPALEEYVDDEDMARQIRDATDEAVLRRENRQ